MRKLRITKKTVGTSSTKILSANTGRFNSYTFVKNISSNTVYLQMTGFIKPAALQPEHIYTFSPHYIMEARAYCKDGQADIIIAETRRRLKIK